MLYDLAIVIYDFIVHLAAPFSRKPRKMMKGHWVVYELLRQQVEKGEQYIWFHAASLGVADMFQHLKENIKDWTSVDEIDTYYTRMLNKEVYNKTGLIYGIGHAVYTISDPRALLLKELARDLAREKGRESEFAFLELLEERAIATFGRVKNNGKTVSSNIDFYSGFVYEMIGLPKEIFTPLFAMARIVGWCAHRNEELTFDGKRIIRPAYKNVLDDLAYIPIKKR